MKKIIKSKSAKISILAIIIATCGIYLLPIYFALKSVVFFYLSVIIISLTFGTTPGLITAFICTILYLPFYVIHIDLLIQKGYHLDVIFQIMILITLAVLTGEVTRIRRKETDRLKLIDKVTKELSTYHDLKQLLKSIMDAALRIIDAETSSLWLIDKDKEELICEAAYGVDEEKIGSIKLKLGEGITGYVAKEGIPQIVNDLQKDPRFKNPLGRSKKLRTQLSVPLKIKEDIIGVLNVFDKKGKLKFTLQDQELLSMLAAEISIALYNTKLIQEQQLKIREVSSLFLISEQINTSGDLKSLLDIVIHSTVKALDASSGSIMLLDDNNELTIASSYGIPQEIVENTKLKLGDDIAGYVAKYDKLLLIDDAKKLPVEVTPRENITSALCVPLKTQDKIIGTISVNSEREDRKFKKRDLNFFYTIASLVASAIERDRLYKELIITNLHTIQALASTLDVRDAYTHTHSKDTVEYVTKIGQRMGLNEMELKTLEYAASLHDIGKIGISDSILRKPAKLSEDEFEIIKNHVKIAANIIAPIKFLQDAIPLIYHHHEKYDGSGYPEALKGDEIPLGARILCVVDAFGAMTSNRPYRKAMSYPEAIEELKRCSGTHFDPKIVNIFLDILEEELKIITV